MPNKCYNGDAALEGRVRVLESLMAEREKSLTLTATNLEHRLAMLNELRGDVLTKSEYIRAHEAVIDRVEKIEKFQGKLIGMGIVFVAVSFLLGIFMSHLLKP